MTGHNTRKQMSIPELTPFEAANEINHRFISAAEDIPKLDINHLPAFLPSRSPPPTISPEEVYQGLLKLTLNKSGGPDNFPPSSDQGIRIQTLYPLAEVFNCSLRSGTVPDMEKRPL